MVSSGSFRNQNHKRKDLPDNTWIDSGNPGNYPTKAENFRKDHPRGLTWIGIRRMQQCESEINKDKVKRTVLPVQKPWLINWTVKEIRHI